MEINDATIEKLAGLSRLKFEAAEKGQIKNDLQKMIGFIEKMNELDTNDVEPLLHMSGSVNIMRNDKVEGSISNEDALKNAGKSKAPYFIVPTVIKK